MRALVADAQAPVLLAGSATQLGGIPAALVEFAEATGIGIVASQMGKGALAEDHHLSLRTLSLNTPDIATGPLERSDLILAVGFHLDLTAEVRQWSGVHTAGQITTALEETSPLRPDRFGWAGRRRAGR